MGQRPEPLSAHMKYAAFAKQSAGESPIVQRFFSGASLCESRKRTSSFLHANFGQGERRKAPWGNPFSKRGSPASFFVKKLGKKLSMCDAPFPLMSADKAAYCC